MSDICIIQLCFPTQEKESSLKLQLKQNQELINELQTQTSRKPKRKTASERRKDVLRTIDKLDKREKDEYRRRNERKDPESLKNNSVDRKYSATTTTSNDSGCKHKSERDEDGKQDISRNHKYRKSRRSSKSRNDESNDKHDSNDSSHPDFKNSKHAPPKTPRSLKSRRSSSLDRSSNSKWPEPVKIRDPRDPLPRVPPRRPMKPIYMKNNTPGISSPKKLEKLTDSDLFGSDLVPVAFSTQSRSISANQICVKSMIRSRNVDFGEFDDVFEGRCGNGLVNGLSESSVHVANHSLPPELPLKLLPVSPHSYGFSEIDQISRGSKQKSKSSKSSNFSKSSVQSLAKTPPPPVELSYPETKNVSFENVVNYVLSDDETDSFFITGNGRGGLTASATAPILKHITKNVCLDVAGNSFNGFRKAENVDMKKEWKVEDFKQKQSQNLNFRNFQSLSRDPSLVPPMDLRNIIKNPTLPPKTCLSRSDSTILDNMYDSSITAKKVLNSFKMQILPPSMKSSEKKNTKDSNETGVPEIASELTTSIPNMTEIVNDPEFLKNPELLNNQELYQSILRETQIFRDTENRYEPGFKDNPNIRGNPNFQRGSSFGLNLGPRFALTKWLTRAASADRIQRYGK